jgi:LPS export ABC transporter protein LptC
MHTLTSYKIYLKTAAIIFATVFFSCQDNYDDIKRMQKISLAPAGIAENINLKQTDSGIVKLNLISKKMIDFSNKNFAHTIFPQGIELHLYDDDDNSLETIILSDYAIHYDKTDLIDLRGNVRITTPDGIKLLTEQLYYDQKTEWVFTNNEYRYEGKDGEYNVGKGGFDANNDMSIFSSIDNDGQQYIKD